MIGFFLRPGAHLAAHSLEGLYVQTAARALVEVFLEKTSVLEAAFDVVFVRLMIRAVPLLLVHSFFFFLLRIHQHGLSQTPELKKQGQ